MGTGLAQIRAEVAAFAAAFDASVLTPSGCGTRRPTIENIAATVKARASR